MKHAYLMIVHNDFYTLEKLLRCLDYYLNDIYIHIDSKAKEIDLDSIHKSVKHSKIYILKDRKGVNWGGYSLVEVEMLLMKEAKKVGYNYYHLLSGVDLPLKSQKYIHDFFNNKEFQYIDIQEDSDKLLYKRLGVYAILIDNRMYRKSKFIQLCSKIINTIQYTVGINRLKNVNMEIKFGSQWFSVTDACVSYILEKENLIKTMFRYTKCADEVFIQTIVYNSPFKSKIYPNGNLRKIDWTRGAPYCFQNQDYEDLIKGNKLFGRKFSSSVDKLVIDRITNQVKTNRRKE